MRSEIDELRRHVEDARNMVVLTGAGISTESGIPDFRSPGGIWSQFRIIGYSEFMADEKARLEDWRRRFAMEDMMGDIRPNIGHEVIAGWARSGKCSCLVTQNIDGLHREAGTPEEAIIEIHGNARSALCTACGLRHTIEDCRKQVGAGSAPVCVSCQGIVKSAVVMFGETMPVAATDQAFAVAESCDLFIAIGTSLLVHPAASLPLAAKRNGAALVIINGEATPADRHGDLVVHGRIGEVLGAL